MQFKRVRTPDEADADSVIVTLFLCKLNKVRGWYVGPIAQLKAGGKVPYVAPSAQLLGITALVRAQSVATEMGLSVYVVDPGNLWDLMMRI